MENVQAVENGRRTVDRHTVENMGRLWKTEQTHNGKCRQTAENTDILSMDRRPVEHTDRHTVVNTDGPTKENGIDTLCKTQAAVEAADRHTV